MKLNDQKKQRIHVKIGEFRIPLVVLSEQEEEILRKAGKQVNKCNDEYQKIFPIMSKEEILAITALRLATVIFKMEKNEDINPLFSFSESFDKELK